MKEVLPIAKKVRKTLEIFACSHDSVDEDYHKDEELGAMCLVASAFLAQLLTKHGYYVKIQELQFGGMSHCFAVVNDHAIDLTATQFLNYKKKVVIRPFRRYLDWLMDLHSERIPTLIEPNWQKWPIQQRPRQTILQKLENIYDEL